MINRSVESMITKSDHKPHLMLPGTNELLVEIARAHSYLLLNSTSHQDRNLENEFETSTRNIKLLMSSSIIDYSTFLMRGFVLVSVELNENAKRSLEKSSMRRLYDLVELSSFRGIFNWKQIENSLNLRTVS
jgi:hypothetical protein